MIDLSQKSLQVNTNCCKIETIPDHRLLYLLWKLGQIHGSKEVIAHLEHLQWSVTLLDHLTGDIHKRLIGERRDKVGNMGPLLSPHISK